MNDDHDRLPRHVRLLTPGRGHEDPTRRPIWPGTIGPAAGTPPRVPGSFRRTSTVDIAYPVGLTPLVLHGAGRDLHTDEQGVAQVLDTATLDAIIDMSAGRVIREASIPALVGLPATSGYRRALPDVAEPGSVLALLLDEIPSTTIISGSALARSGRLPLTGREGQPPVGTCAGWVLGGDMVSVLERGEQPYLGEGPSALALDDTTDALAWHELTELAPGTMRRRRRLDVARSTAEVFFRDSYVELSGVETVVHEYGIDLSFDRKTHVITGIEAVPHVLPGPDCPNAASSAIALVGMRLDDVREHVARNFSGVPTCTHLNDALRSVGDLFTFIR